MFLHEADKLKCAESYARVLYLGKNVVWLVIVLCTSVISTTNKTQHWEGNTIALNMLCLFCPHCREAQVYKKSTDIISLINPRWTLWFKTNLSLWHERENDAENKRMALNENTKLVVQLPQNKTKNNPHNVSKSGTNLKTGVQEQSFF